MNLQIDTACIRPNVSKTKQLKHKQSQNMKYMPTDIL